MFLQRSGESIGDGAHAATSQAPGADIAVHITHHVMQQDIGGARGVDTQCGTDDAGAGHGGLDQVILEIVLEKVGGAHGEEADVFIQFALTQLPELLGQVQEFPDVAWPERCGSGGVRSSVLRISCA